MVTQLGIRLGTSAQANRLLFKGAAFSWIPRVVCAEMRGCATLAACLILLLLSNDSSMN